MASTDQDSKNIAGATEGSNMPKDELTPIDYTWLRSRSCHLKLEAEDLRNQVENTTKPNLDPKDNGENEDVRGTLGAFQRLQLQQCLHQCNPLQAKLSRLFHIFDLWSMEYMKKQQSVQCAHDREVVYQILDKCWDELQALADELDKQLSSVVAVTNLRS